MRLLLTIRVAVAGEDRDNDTKLRQVKKEKGMKRRGTRFNMVGGSR